ncbi:tyrosine phosphatase family protein [Hirsutella rhossiliensis]|uniref:Tyrosine phosphatase family domain-containing protein n=1 Tax=Hirsutella rhossiliensis TaxID=111463 RepID=A0A9P8NAT0_9HYPO|nr:tyrosine phosphatase family domain-containing protein [Hirsutella rhossiliensis]KAH0968849.1 tyrosine phosphatase family domain-containing protein [Hirsutella rhossiliensis]
MPGTADPFLAQLEELAATDPFVPTRSLINLRDAGVVPGSRLPKGRFYRCGTLDYAAKDPQALAWLAAKVTRIFDLQKGVEREHGLDPVVEGVENAWLDGQGEYPSLTLDDFVADGGRPAWREQYLAIVSCYQPTIRALLEHIRGRPAHPILFHCTAGRDRTGVVAGLLQHLAGTPAGLACLDYMLSRIGAEPAREKLLHFALSTAGTTDPRAPGFRNLISLRPEFWSGSRASKENTADGTAT